MMRRLAALLAIPLVACGPDYETEHLRITTHFDFPLCEGNLDTYERMIDEFEVQVGDGLHAPLDVDLWSRDWEETGRRNCGAHWSGCYHAVTHRVFAHFDRAVIGHEIVHAFTREPAYSDLFFIEGTAEALSDSTEFGRSRPVLTPRSGEIDYGPAGHFVRWLVETRGRDCVRAVLAVNHSDAASTFAANCGSTFDAAVEEYTSTAPWTYPPPFTCEFDASGEYTLGDQPLEFTVELDCASTDTLSSTAGIHTYRTLHVTSPGRYVLWTDASGMALRRCIDEPQPIAPGFTTFDDGVPSTSSLGFRGFRGGQFGMVRLEAGDHLLSVGGDSWTDVQEFNVRIEPAPPLALVP